MKNLDPMVFLAVLQEMMRLLLWLLIALAVASLAGLSMVLARERRIDSHRLVWAEAVGLLGGVASLMLMAKVIHSGFTDAGGPVDWLLIGVIFGMGAAGVTVLAYVAMGCIKHRCGCCGG